MSSACIRYHSRFLRVQLVLLLTVLSLAPAIIILMTSFTRLVVIFGILRQALGTQQSPPTQVIIGLSLFLTLFIMFPVFGFGCWCNDGFWEFVIFNHPFRHRHSAQRPFTCPVFPCSMA